MYYKSSKNARGFICVTAKESFGALFNGSACMWDWHDFSDADAASRFIAYAQSIGLEARLHSACDYFTGLPIHPNRVLTRDMPKD